MTSQLVLLRKAVLAAILGYQSSPGFAYNSFVAAESWIPYQKIENPATQAGKVWVIAGCVDDRDRKTRHGSPGGTLVTREACVQVAYQQANVLADNITLLDTLMCVQEQLRDVIKNYDFGNPQTLPFAPLWVRNESLKDENGIPVHYYMLREGNVFESYFTAFFTYPHTTGVYQ